MPLLWSLIFIIRLIMVYTPGFPSIGNISFNVISFIHDITYSIYLRMNNNFLNDIIFMCSGNVTYSPSVKMTTIFINRLRQIRLYRPPIRGASIVACWIILTCWIYSWAMASASTAGANRIVCCLDPPCAIVIEWPSNRNRSVLKALCRMHGASRPLVIYQLYHRAMRSVWV